MPDPKKKLVRKEVVDQAQEAAKITKSYKSSRGWWCNSWNNWCCC